MGYWGDGVMGYITGSGSSIQVMDIERKKERGMPAYR